ncbi:MAG TPA: RluA family pseudouridine synthase, partial [Treponemataceae bacterium]|nr:RluA family pseudouridine synthase [Treponemataceae bacterium]
MPICTFVVENPDNTAVRLDAYAASVLPDNISRSRLKAGLKKLTVNGKNAKLSAKIKHNDTVVIEWEDPVPQEISPEDIPLTIVYEDENVTVLNKKQGMVTHPANGNWTGTLVNALLFHWGKEAVVNTEQQSVLSIANRRPGIVHRLDKDTSG